ncbi:YdeI/OmpD-associated family protein [Aureispira anguillae]|uniref:YdeI/OmpD-associated family protein n=1 Tax=Aureispira anguillae TaxID=2864201 RepID=A0A915YF79_9BACT|nr:YdeI/OmpD-associated family protein [Aureispira anguillae]BDS11929.1 YdeI/OmpD-associated family protein [Aureispira anguillae]
MKKHQFSAIIQASDRGGAFVLVPFDVEKEMGAKRPKVAVLFEGQESYRGTLVRMKTSSHILIVRKDIRLAINKQIGDHINVELWLDTAARVVEIPPHLQKAFETEQKAANFFKTLSYTCQKEYANYITSAKRESTKERRTLKAIELLQKSIKTPL